jgi:hypothetical protein
MEMHRLAPLGESWRDLWAVSYDARRLQAKEKKFWKACGARKIRAAAETICDLGQASMVTALPRSIDNELAPILRFERHFCAAKHQIHEVLPTSERISYLRLPQTSAKTVPVVSIDDL